MSPCFALAGSNSKRPLEMVLYDPAAASQQLADMRARQQQNEEAAAAANSSSSSASGGGAMVVPHAAVLDVAPISTLPPLPRLPVADRVEPPCLRRHFLAALGLRADLPVHFIDDKYVTSTDLDSHQNRFRIPSSGVERRLRPLLSAEELDAASLLHDPCPVPKKRPRLLEELQMSRWESSRGTIVKGEGYLDFIRACGFRERDAVEIWAFVQRRVRLFGADVCDDSLLHLLLVKKQQGKEEVPPRCCYCPAPHVVHQQHPPALLPVP